MLIYFLSDIYFYFLLLIFFSFIFFSRSKNTLKLLIISELFWITFYSFSVTTSLNMDNLVLLSLSLFFLMFSAAEIAMGIGLIVVQHRFFSGSEFFSTPGFNFFVSNKS